MAKRTLARALGVAVHRSSARSIAAVSMGALLIAACTSEPGDDEGASSAAVKSGAGRWRLSAEVAAAGARVRVKYDDAPEWDSSQCAGKLVAGARKLADHLKKTFKAEVSSVEGYACRPNTADTSQMSVHGTGRALDVMIPTRRGDADNTKGDRVASWLVLNAQRIGVQLIIWDRTIWRSNGRNDGTYGGPHPHDDHIHVEINRAAAAQQTEWFKSGGAGTPPDSPGDPGASSCENGSDEEFSGAAEDEDNYEYEEDGDETY